MKKNIIGYCPICESKLQVKTLYCKNCETEITGEFMMTPFDYLNKEQLNFALVFIQCGGNIKQIEKKLNISYPTVKKNLDELCCALGMTGEGNFVDIKLDRDVVKQKLKNGEISFEDAEEILGGL